MEPEKSIIKEFLNGGWLVPLIGAAAMFARLLSAPNELSIKTAIQKNFYCGSSIGSSVVCSRANRYFFSHQSYYLRNNWGCKPRSNRGYS